MKDDVQIVKNFGVPGSSKYDFDELDVGSAKVYSDLSKYRQLRSAASRQGKKLKRKFSVRLITEQPKSGAAVKKIAVVRVK